MISSELAEALDAAINRGLAEADAGMGRPAEEVMARLQSRYRAMFEGLDPEG